MTDPYREGKPLADLIPPDRRRQRAIMMVASGVLGGALLIEALHLATAKSPEADVAPPPKTPPVQGLPGPITRDEITSVVAAHRAALRETCFGSKPTPTSAQVTIDLVVGVDGDVASTSTQGSDPVVTRCVESQIRQWHFPAHAEPSVSTRIPFLFERT